MEKKYGSLENIIKGILHDAETTEEMAECFQNTLGHESLSTPIEMAKEAIESFRKEDQPTEMQLLDDLPHTIMKQSLFDIILNSF